MSTTHEQSGEAIDVRGEVVVQCLEGEVAITGSAKTENLHAGELVYLSAEEPHSVAGGEDASVLLSYAPNAKRNASGENETMHARGLLLSVMQAAFFTTALALLLFAVAGNIFAGVLVVGAGLVLCGCLHYWVWGRWMKPALSSPRRKELPL